MLLLTVKGHHQTQNGKLICFPVPGRKPGVPKDCNNILFYAIKLWALKFVYTIVQFVIHKNLIFDIHFIITFAKIVKS